MSELDDIRKLIDPRDLDFVRRHSNSLHSDQVLDITSRRYGGRNGKTGVTALKIVAVTLVACAIIVAGMAYMKTKKHN